MEQIYKLIEDIATSKNSLFNSINKGFLSERNIKLSESEERLLESKFVTSAFDMLSNMISNDRSDFIEAINDSRGNFKNFKFYDDVKFMKTELERVKFSSNEFTELVKLFDTLDSSPNPFDTSFNKTHYTVSVIQLTSGLTKNYLSCVDITSSKNQHTLVVKNVRTEDDKSLTVLKKINSVPKTSFENKGIFLDVAFYGSLFIAYYAAFKALIYGSMLLRMMMYNWLTEFVVIRNAIAASKNKSEADIIILKLIDKIESFRDKYFTVFKSSETNIVNEIQKDMVKQKTEKKNNNSEVPETKEKPTEISTNSFV